MSNTMNYRGYTASMAFDTDDKIIVGRVVDIDDIITFHGDSVGEFEVAFHAVIDDSSPRVNKPARHPRSRPAAS